MACGACGHHNHQQRRLPALEPRQPVRLPITPAVAPEEFLMGVAPGAGPSADPNDPNAMSAERRRIDSLRRQAIRRALGIG